MANSFYSLRSYGFLCELRRRKVYRVAAGYAGVGRLIIQVAVTVFATVLALVERSLQVSAGLVVNQLRRDSQSWLSRTRLTDERRGPDLRPRDSCSETAAPPCASVVVVAGGIIQLASAVFQAWELPNWTLRLTVVLPLIGFPVALILAWTFDFESQGIRTTPRRPSKEEVSARPLGVIGFQFLSGAFPARTVRARREVYKRTGCPDPLRDRIESLLRY